MLQDGNVRNRTEGRFTDGYDARLRICQGSSMPAKILQSFADELRVWRVTVIKLRDVNGAEVGDLIHHIDATLESIVELQAEVVIDRVSG